MRELRSRPTLYIICLVCGSDTTRLGGDRLNMKHLEDIEHKLNEDLATREREALKLELWAYTKPGSNLDPWVDMISPKLAPLVRLHDHRLSQNASSY